MRQYFVVRSGQLQRDSEAAGKQHLGNRRKEPAIAAVMIGQQHVTLVEFLDRGKETLQQVGIVKVRGITTRPTIRLRETGTTHTVFALPKVKQQQVTRLIKQLQLWRQMFANVGHGREGRNDQ